MDLIIYAQYYQDFYLLVDALTIDKYLQSEYLKTDRWSHKDCIGHRWQQQNKNKKKFELQLQAQQRLCEEKVINLMKSITQQKNKSPCVKNEETSASTDEDRKLDSITRLIKSEHLTLQMAVNYLFTYRKNLKIISLLLQRLQHFCLTKSPHYIPTIIFIMSLDYQQQYFKFCESLANQSLPLYLLVRWSYTAYWGEQKKLIETLRNKLDSSLIGKMKFLGQEQFNQDLFKNRIKQKQNYSNYLSVLNDFYDRLFKIPEKLKKYQKPKRNEKLRQYINKITTAFMKDQNGYLNGIAFPINEDSPINVRMVLDHCFTFSTKERVPFKLVFQTISYEDAMLCKNGKFPEKQMQNQNSTSVLQHSKSLILPTTYFGQLWEDSEIKIKKQSPYSSMPSYKIRSYMIKSGDDLRQQYMAMQLIKLIEEIAKSENIKIWVRSYAVIPFNSDSGLIEFVSNTKTVSYLKQKSNEKSLRKIYQQMFGSNWQQSIINFIQSLAGYSLIQYLFQIKDRHNNNILVDTQGHIIHIDFSFMISSSPGNMNFEKAPFKLTQDYIELMQGKDSDIFAHFKLLFFLGLKFIRKFKKQIMDTVMMMSSCQMKCFYKFDREAMQKRFHQNATDDQLSLIVEGIMADAYSSYTTSNYDRYQWYTNFIYS